jgi:alginate O-acetyltransferase complex protein AlgI
MVFNSFEFVFFFALVYVLYRLLSHKRQNYLLLAASYIFYGSWDWRFLFLLFASTCADYICARQIGKSVEARHKKYWLIAGLCVNLTILGFFKYFNFFAENLSSLLSLWNIQVDPFVLKVILPVGVSFYTFQSISYLADVYTQKIRPERKFFYYALFVSFFPQLVAGPIERAEHMLPQYKFLRQLTAQKNREGVWFIWWGFFLKVFLADNMARIVNLVFSQTGQVPGIEVLVGTYAFAFQVFGDFAGYSFIAMGAARLLGIDLMVNFLFPYFVTNPRDFWRNWHISLSSWLRDYLYIPLGGNRHGEWKTCRNLLVTMFLGGLWHGAAWTFVIWGMYQGLTLYVFKMFLMFQVTCLGWLMFRANSLEQLKSFCHSLFFNFGAPSDKAVYMILQIIFYAAMVWTVQILQKRSHNLMAVPDMPGIRPWIIYGVMFYLLVMWGEFGGKEFIYFQF